MWCLRKVVEELLKAAKAKMHLSSQVAGVTAMDQGTHPQGLATPSTHD